MKYIKPILYILCFGCMLSGYSQTHTLSFSYVVPPMPVVHAGNDTFHYCWTPFILNGNVTGGTAPFSYLWQPGTYLNDSTILNPTAIFTPGPSSVVFTLTVIDANGCEASDDVEIYCVINAVEEVYRPSVRIYPNPSDGDIFLEGVPAQAGQVTVRCYSLPGEMLFSRQLSPSGPVLATNLGSLTPGIYLVRITIDGYSSQHKFILQ